MIQKIIIIEGVKMKPSPNNVFFYLINREWMFNLHLKKTVENSKFTHLITENNQSIGLFVIISILRTKQNKFFFVETVNLREIHCTEMSTSCNCYSNYHFDVKLQCVLYMFLFSRSKSDWMSDFIVDVGQVKC